MFRFSHHVNSGNLNHILSLNVLREFYVKKLRDILKKMHFVLCFRPRYRKLGDSEMLKCFMPVCPPISLVTLTAHQLGMFSSSIGLSSICALFLPHAIYLSCTDGCCPRAPECSQSSDLKHSVLFSPKGAQFLVEKKWPLYTYLSINVSHVS